MDNLMIRYSRCCQPVPGDNVIGYITQGRGVSIHQMDCPNILDLSEDRRVEIEWTAEKGDRFYVRLYMEGTDRRGLLSDVAKAISDTGTDIVKADMRGVERGMLGRFSVEVQDLSHLTKVMNAIGRVDGVVQVHRRQSSTESAPVAATSFGAPSPYPRCLDSSCRRRTSPKGINPPPSRS